jgi:hypothetical protein
MPIDCCTAEFRPSSQPDLGLLGVNSGRVRLIGVGLEGIDCSGLMVATRTAGTGRKHGVQAGWGESPNRSERGALGESLLLTAHRCDAGWDVPSWRQP